MDQTASLELADGRLIHFTIRGSSKSRSISLKLNARSGLLVTVPAGIAMQQVMDLVTSKADWIAHHLSRFDEVRHLLTEAVPVRPQAFDLPALAESWRVEYLETRAKRVGARSDRPGRLIVSGAVEDTMACQAALRRWLARHAKQHLASWLQRVSEETGLRFSDVAIKSQRTRWGSCSADKRISLNCKLLFLPRDLVRYVLVHELCHTMEPNHSQRFWTLVGAWTPSVEQMHGRMQEAWKLVPTWAVPVRPANESHLV